MKQIYEFKTLVHKEVRDAWQLDAKYVQINKEFDEYSYQIKSFRNNTNTISTTSHRTMIHPLYLLYLSVPQLA